MQNCSSYVASNLLRFGGSRQHSARFFPLNSWQTDPCSGTVTKNNAWWNASRTKLTTSFTLPLSPCMYTTPLKLKGSLVLSIEKQIQVERHFFFLHRSEKLSLLLALVGTGLTAFSYCEQVQYASASSQHFHFSQTQRCPPLVIYI